MRSGGKALAVSVSAAVFVTTLTALMAPGTVRAVPLPTGLPISATTSIHLRSQRCTGTIPTELGLLTRLTYVDIAENWLTGPMPTELGLLTLVNSSFSLGSNLVSLAIPTELGKLIRMSYGFWLYSNLLSSTIPTQLGQLNLMGSNFYLYSNSLSSTIPTQLGQLNLMTYYFSLRANMLSSTIPTQLGQLEQMGSYFDLSTNSLSSTIPTQLGLLEQMSSYFDLSTNHLLSAIPTQLGLLDQINSGFYLYINSLSSAIPTQLGLLDQMNSNFNLWSNSLSSTIPTQLGQLKQMASDFILRLNQLTGPTPTELGRLEQMRSNFDISYNEVLSAIPTQLGLLVHMSSDFRLQSNSLSLAIPTELGKLEQMASHFYPEGNYLTGPIPTGLGQLEQMTSTFDISRNMLELIIPSQLGRLEQMTSTFDISLNMLALIIPSQLGRLDKFQSHFFLHDLAMVYEDDRVWVSGPVPTQLGRLTKLTGDFALQNNHFCQDSLPTEIAALSTFVLEGWDVLEGNSFGTVCGAYIDWPRLPLLPSSLTSAGGLSGRYFTGTIPTEYGLITTLVALDLSDNLLTSVIPTELGDLTAASSFQLESNMLCAQLPTQLQALSARDSVEWAVAAGNSLGTPCLPLPPTPGPTDGLNYDDNGDHLIAPSSTSGVDSSSVTFGEVLAIASCSIAAAVAVAAVAFRYRKQAAALLRFGEGHHHDDETDYIELSMVPDDDSSAGESSGGLSSSAWQYCLDSWQNGGKQVPARACITTPLLYNSCAAPDQFPVHPPQHNTTQHTPPHTHHTYHAQPKVIVLDHNLCVVVWSRGMTKAAAGYEPAFGETLNALPFPSAEHRESVVSKLESIMHDEAPGSMFHPLHALQAAVVADPNVVVHFVTPLGVGLEHDTVLSMAAVQIMPPRSSSSSAHVLLVGHEQMDPKLVSLWAANDVPSDVSSDLTSDANSGGITVSESVIAFLNKGKGYFKPRGRSTRQRRMQAGDESGSAPQLERTPRAAFAEDIAHQSRGVFDTHPDSGDSGSLGLMPRSRGAASTETPVTSTDKPASTRSDNQATTSSDNHAYTSSDNHASTSSDTQATTSLAMNHTNETHTTPPSTDTTTGEP